jgi:hypothetical protein
MSEDNRGPVDGEEIELKLTPHHAKDVEKKGGLGKLLIGGTVVVGGVVLLYLLYKHYIKPRLMMAKMRHTPIWTGPQAKRKRDFEVGDAAHEEMIQIYNDALEDEEFLRFVEEMKDSGMLDSLT